jgi:hypothetical protein
MPRPLTQSGCLFDQVLPIILTTAVFSMEPSAIPFTPNRTTFVGVLFAAVFVVILLDITCTSDKLHPWKQKCSGYIRQHVPVFFGKPDNGQNDRANQPEDVGFTEDVENSIPSVTQARSSTPVTYREGPVKRLKREETSGTMKTLVNE